MQDYYRNVALWLATPQQRASMLRWAIWGVLVGLHPGALDRVMGIWELGRRVVDVIGRTAPQCLVEELVEVFMPDLSTVLPSAPESDQETPVVAPIRAMVNQAIVGGIAFELLEDAHEVMLERIHGQTPDIDAERLRGKAAVGANAGLAALRRELLKGADQLASVAAYLPERPEPFDGHHGSDD
jgi:hypothetical protein